MVSKLQTWDDVRQAFDALYAEPFRRPSTRTQMRITLRRLERFALAPGDVDVVCIQRLAADVARRCCGQTVNTVMRQCRTVCRKLLALGALERDPFAVQSFRVRPTRSAARGRRWFSVEEISRALAVADAEAAGLDSRPLNLLRLPVAEGPARPRRASADWKAGRRRALLYLLAYCGLRAGEALHLRPADVELWRRDQAGRVWSAVVIRSGDGWQTKTAASEAPVPLAEPAAQVLGAWLRWCGPHWVFPCSTRPDRPWTSGGPGAKPCHELRALGLRAGLDGLTLLSLRHSWATNARTVWGLGRDQVRLVLRHTRDSTQDDWYVHRDGAALAGMLAPVVSFSKGVNDAATGVD